MLTARTVQLVIISTDHSTRELTEIIGLDGDQVQTISRSHRDTSVWELSHVGTTDVDVTTMIEDVLGQIAVVRSSVQQLCAEPGVKCKLRIVLYIEDDERVNVGPGFAIRPPYLKLLAELNATVDADLYGWAPESSA